MTLPVTIENDALSLEVWPQLGGKVSSIIDKADKYELLFNYPAELPTRPLYDMPYPSSWYAGWDECFPAVGPGTYSGHPYDGVPVPDHGELWGLPTTAVPAKHGITTVWHGLRFGYRLTRKLHIEGASLIADYMLENLAPFEFRFVWAQHCLMSMASPAELQVPDGGEFRISHDADGNLVNAPFQWPVGDDGADFSRLASLPAKRGWKLFSQRPISFPVVVQYPARQRRLTIEYTPAEDLPAYWGLWINTGGWAGHRHFAVEPTTGRFDYIDRAIKDGSAGRVPASGRRDWQVKWTLSP